MEKETMGTVISVIKQWWLKVNRKPARVHAMDGAAFPHTIKVIHESGRRTDNVPNHPDSPAHIPVPS